MGTMVFAVVKLHDPGLTPMPHRPEMHRWYCTAGWQRRRVHQLRVEPLCRICLDAGHITPATVADHIEPRRSDWNAFKLGPLRNLCADCPAAAC
jgi:hypothetical protein